MKLLDLYCGAGGATEGYRRAGFEVTGVELNPKALAEWKERHPGEFLNGDVLELDPEWIAGFDLVHASPPCQHFAMPVVTQWKDRRDQFPDLVSATRAMLEASGCPFVIENVMNAPIRRDLVLCGEMFGLRVIRHRAFEVSGFLVNQPTHPKHHPRVIDPARKRGGHSYYYQVAGNGGESPDFTLANWRAAMGVDWPMSKDALVESIPPAYAEYIGRAFCAGRA